MIKNNPITIKGEIIYSPCLNMTRKNKNKNLVLEDFNKEVGFSIITLHTTYEVMITNREVMEYCEENENKLYYGSIVEVTTPEFRDGGMGIYYLKISDKGNIKIIK